MLLKQAVARDIPAVKKIFKKWTGKKPVISEILDGPSRLNRGQNGVRLDVVEIDKSVRCACLWRPQEDNQIDIIAFDMSNGADELGVDSRFLLEEILEWADMKVSRVTISVPEELCRPIAPALRNAGFISEGMSCFCGSKDEPLIHFSKHFCYEVVPSSDIMILLRNFMTLLGYEVQTDSGGFGYRIRSEYGHPFIFNSWHKVSRSGSDIIVHPPARVLEPHEIETLFYPLTIEFPEERALLVSMEKKRAEALLEFPDSEAYQNSLFADKTLPKFRILPRNNLTYTYPVNVQGLRKGLPLVFYVNKVGVVGSGRLEDWYLDEPKNLYNQIDEMGFFEPEDVKEYAATTGPKAGKVLLLRFHWYKALKRPVPLEEIRKIDETFNPQRTRTVSPEFFRMVHEVGNLKNPESDLKSTDHEHNGVTA